MKQLFIWLQSKISPPESPFVENQPDSSLTADPGQASPHRSGPDDLMPDIYAQADSESDTDTDTDADADLDLDADTKPDLRILDLPSPDSDESTGFDPYDSGVLQKK